MKNTLIGLALATTALAVCAQEQSCREAEGEIADVSVQAVAAYQATDLEKARRGLSEALKKVATGQEAVASCGCKEASGKLTKANDMLQAVMKAEDLPTLQDRLFDAIKASEDARQTAEQCWRKQLMAAKAK